MTEVPGFKPTRRRHIYYKVQIYDEVSMVWRDEKQAFEDFKSAKEFVGSHVKPGAKARLMQVDGKTRKPVAI